MGYGYRAVEEKESKRYVGELGFADFKRGILPSVEGLPEIGFALIVQAHGKGYATEALKTVVAWADSHLDSTCTI
jgi:RimJ/RimL family protein N-acetyltransferase